MIRRRRVTQAAAAGWLAAALPTPSAAAPPVVTVEIRDYKYLPPHLSIKPGTVVRWVNAEKRTTHTVRFAGAELVESDRLFPGDSYERLFDKPGVFAYLCGPHPEMTGSIEVRP